MTQGNISDGSTNVEALSTELDLNAAIKGYTDEAKLNILLSECPALNVFESFSQ